MILTTRCAAILTASECVFLSDRDTCDFPHTATDTQRLYMYSHLQQQETKVSTVQGTHHKTVRDRNQRNLTVKQSKRT